MPAKTYDFLRMSGFQFEPPVGPACAERVCQKSNGSLQLRRLDTAEERFSPTGSYVESWVLFPEHAAGGVDRLVGFDADIITSGTDKSDVFGGSVSFRLSNDGGVTWLVYDAGAWVEAAGPLSTVWMTKDEVAEHVDEFPYEPQRRLRILMRMSPGSGGASTPVVENVVIYEHYDYDFVESMLRSMKHYLESNLKVETSWRLNVSNKSRIEVEHYWSSLSTPIKVYNLTTDPNETTNLFDHVDGKGIVLTSAQTGLILAKMKAIPKIYIGAEDFIQIAELPSVIVEVSSAKEIRDWRQKGYGEIDVNQATNRAWRSYCRTHFEVTYRISCQSSLKHEAVKMADVLDKILTQDKIIVDEAVDSAVVFFGGTPISPTDNVSVGLFSRAFEAVAFATAWLRPDEYEDLYLVTEHVVHVTP